MTNIRGLVNPGKMEDYIGQSKNLQNAIEHTHEMVALLDVNSFKPVYSNTGILQMLGYSDEEIKNIGSGWNEKVIHPDDKEILMNMITHLKHLKPGERSRLVYRAKAQDGQWYKFESNAIAISGGDAEVTEKAFTVTRILDIRSMPESEKWEGRAERRCKNCRKLLGIENIPKSEVEVKCGRCGELNAFQM